MSELWAALGYDQVAAEVARAIHDGDDINVIQGPPGVGKSWLAKGIGEMWKSAGGSTVVAEGDDRHATAALYPLGFAMAPLASGWRLLGPDLANLAKAGESLFGTAGLITSTVQALAKARRKHRRARSLFLGNAEQSILFDLGGLGHKRPVLLIADNLHWWDAASLDFLARLRTERMRDAFPFLAQMRVLGVQTIAPYQEVLAPEAHDALLAPAHTRCFPLARVPREAFEDVLSALGADRSRAVLAAPVVYNLSGGHLVLAGRWAQRLVAGAGDDFLSGEADDFISRLLSERVRTLGALGADAMALLQVAAVLGLTFRRDELTCATGGDEAGTARVLRQCRDEDVLQLSGSVATFVHDLYRQHFLGLAGQDKVAIHERLGECLRMLRPGDYELRCLNAGQAERERAAAALAVQAALQLGRDGRSWRELSPLAVEAVLTAGLDGVTESLIRAMVDLNHYRYAQCLEALDRLPHDLPKAVLAEIDYLRAMCLMSTRSETDRARARSILEAWEDLWQQEPELGIRLLQLLLYGLTHLRDKDHGRELEGRLRRILVDRVSFDVAAKDALYTLDRCSGSLYQPDVAVIRNQEAVEYFGPASAEDVIRRPVEYYRCLVNFGATLISNARYDEALAVYADVEALVDRYPADAFPRVDYPRMNAVLAGYRLGRLSADEAVARQRTIVGDMPNEDPFYVENAFAVYLALAGQAEDAVAIFDRLDRVLTSTRAEPEPSMRYLIQANRAAARFVAGEAVAAHAEWHALADVVAQIAYVTRPFLVRRHELLERVLAGPPLSASELDECLVGGAPEFGPLWDNYGRGFRMPEVEFWREN